MNLNGRLYAYQEGTEAELVQVWEYLHKTIGSDQLTGKVYGRPPVIDGMIENEDVPANCWWFELAPALGKV